jgi:hypothetical protein
MAKRRSTVTEKGDESDDAIPVLHINHMAVLAQQAAA